ncbi:MAG: hypothetical protein AAFV98_20320 [Chloroflexota bacterium]
MTGKVKRKIEKTEAHLSAIPFLVWWVVLNGIAFLFWGTILLSTPYIYPERHILTMIALSATTMIIQEILVQFHSGIIPTNMARNGFLVSLLIAPIFALSLSGAYVFDYIYCPINFVCDPFSTQLGSVIFSTFIFFTIPALLYVPTACTHAFVLRQHRPHAWYYPLIMLMYSLLLGIIGFPLSYYYYMEFYLIGILAGILVSGIFMVWFYRQPKYDI